MTPADNNEMWALICTHLDHNDRAVVGLPLVQTGSPRDWMEKILKTLGNYITDDPGDL